jgi:hypothetical protein
MMPSLLRVCEYVKAANFVSQRAHSERKSHAKQMLQEIERRYPRLVEIEKWAVDQQQYNRPFAHFGLFNGHAARTGASSGIGYPMASHKFEVSASLSASLNLPRRASAIPIYCVKAC